MNELEVIRRYAQRYGALRNITPQRVAALWRRLGGVDDASARRFVAAVVPLVTGAQRAAASMLAAYLQALARAAGTTIDATLRLADITDEAIRGTPAAEVYMRPVVTARAGLANGKTFAGAMNLGLIRATSTAETDVILAQREATVTILKANDGIAGYRRVLSGSSCPLCATASTQRYRSSELMPIHSHCDCTIAPIFGDSDPGHVINTAVLSNLKAQGPEYWKGRGFVDDAGNAITPGDTSAVAVHHHGELGPVLTEQGDHFDGPSVAA